MWLLTCLTAVSISSQVINAQYGGYYHGFSQRRPHDPPHMFLPSISDLHPVPRPLDTAPRPVIRPLVTNSTQPVQLDIYYETNCPDSMRFITQQLYPLYQEMKNDLKIRLIPFGKGTAYLDEATKQYNFKCHHGPAECYGNTVQSCVISLYPQIEDHLNLINCMESYPRPSSSAQKCVKRLSLDWNKISKCADGEEGNRLLYENYKVTNNLNPRLHFVPWIVIDKVYNQDKQWKGLRNLKEVMCEHMKNNHPKCTKSRF